MSRVLKLALPIVAAAVLAAPVSAASPINVHGDAGWVTTGITVTAGQQLAVEINGNVQTAPIPDFHVPGDFKSSSGPAGQTTNGTCGDIVAGFPPGLIDITGPCALSDAYFGELLGRVGDHVFAIGATDTITAPASGTLELAANDLVNTYGDNNGAFTVVVK